jgi:hypothetical protein
MRVFFLDLWLDLREKRLAPLAILLLAGIIAVPIVLAKSEKPAPAPPATATTASAPATPVVQSDTTITSSKLQTFSSRDPFEPTTKPTTTTTTPTTSGGTSTGTSTSPSSSTGTTSPSGGGTNGSGPTTTTPPSTGNTGNTTGETKTTLFTYTVDLRFGQGGSVTAYKDVKRLDLIPDEKNPKIVFLGVTTTAKTAVFLVDSNVGVDTAGGKCRPSPDQCTFLYLRPDNDHNQAVLTDPDGNVYHLRLLAIHRVTVSSANGKTTTGNSNGNSNGTGTTRSHAFTGSADKSNSADAATPPGETPPGEPNGSASSFQQFFADGADSKTTSGSGSGH